MAENFLWLVTLQENSKIDKDHEVMIINFLCDTCIMKDKVLNNFCLVVEYDFFTEKWKDFLKNTIGQSIIVLS